jgi:hypothetical protein
LVSREDKRHSASSAQLAISCRTGSRPRKCRGCGSARFPRGECSSIVRSASDAEPQRQPLAAAWPCGTCSKVTKQALEPPRVGRSRPRCERSVREYPDHLTPRGGSFEPKIVSQKPHLLQENNKCRPLPSLPDEGFPERLPFGQQKSHLSSVERTAISFRLGVVRVRRSDL